MGWLEERFTIGEWTPIRWQFFLGIILFLLSWVAYYIVKLLFLGILKILDKALPETWKVDNDIKTHCTRPVCWLGPIIIWFIVINLMDFPDGTGDDWLNKIVLIFLFWQLGALGLGIIRVISAVVLRNGTFSNKEIQSVRWLTKIISVIWVVVWTIIALNNLKVNIDNFVWYSVVVVAAFGYAAKDVLRNFYGGFRVAFARPFGRGDHIRVELKRLTVEGQVAKVGLSDTSIQSTEGYVVVVPNHIFVNQAVINFSRELEQIAVVSEAESLAANPLNKILKKDEAAPEAQKPSTQWPPPATGSL
eukprot:TRINITY_DN9044_c0_g1_i1.p1 TRINITY_DN9044_c0_g1~~TRINITY_DN9044_c0_g1_i1.p1  ORF type:complete len:304 (+),score=41.15 TRINITY_DN9044_c0_g1_i1:61-972(+)